MGNGTGDPGAAAGAPTPDGGPGAASPEALAGQAAETTRMEGVILDAGLKATGYETSPAIGSPAAAGAADRSYFVLRTLDDIAAPPPDGAGATPAPGAGSAAEGASPGQPGDAGATGDSPDMLESAQGITTKSALLLADRPPPGSSFGVRHGYNMAIGGLAVIAFAAFVGALLFMGGSGASPSASPPVPGGAAAAASASSATLPSASPDASAVVAQESLAPSTAVPSAVPTPSPVPQSVTLRGPIDVRAMAKTGLTMGEHTAELIVFLDNKTVRGSFTIAIEKFPIGSLLTATFGGQKDPDYAAFKRCTVLMVLNGPISGTYDPRSGKLTGKATFKAEVDDVDDCLKTRPSNISIDPNRVAKPTTVTWTATFDGTTAKGTLKLKPALGFSATRQD